MTKFQKLQVMQQVTILTKTNLRISQHLNVLAADPLRNILIADLAVDRPVVGAPEVALGELEVEVLSEGAQEVAHVPGKALELVVLVPGGGLEVLKEDLEVPEEGQGVQEGDQEVQEGEEVQGEGIGEGRRERVAL